MGRYLSTPTAVATSQERIPQHKTPNRDSPGDPCRANRDLACVQLFDGELDVLAVIEVRRNVAEQDVVTGSQLHRV